MCLTSRGPWSTSTSFVSRAFPDRTHLAARYALDPDRPRPSTDTDALQSLVTEVVGVPAPRLHVIKDYSVREWTLASDRVMSSFSTTLIEAALAGKPVNTVTPAPVPELLRYDWCALVSDLGSAADLHDALHADSSGNPSRLQAWARAQFQPRGDAIAALAEALGRLAVNRGATSSGTAAESEGGERPRAPRWFFNTGAHDKDVWTPDELAARRARMLRAIGPDVQHPPSSNGPLSLSVVICTRNRQCQLARLLDSLARQAAHTLDVEVLVVDNGSTDETAAVCASRLTATSTVRYCHERRVGLSHARNRGLASGLYRDSAWYPVERLGRVARAMGRIAVRGVGALATSLPPRLTPPLASSLLELARA